MLKTTDNINVEITLNARTYNLLANIMLAIHLINKQPIKTNETEVSELLSKLLETELFTKFLENTFEFYDDYIAKKL